MSERTYFQTEMWDKQNRLLWFIDYASITVEVTFYGGSSRSLRIRLQTLAHCEKSSNSVKFQFWQFEYMLRLVMDQEKKTGKLSGLRHVIDMGGETYLLVSRFCDFESSESTHLYRLRDQSLHNALRLFWNSRLLFSALPL